MKRLSGFAGAAMLLCAATQTAAAATPITLMDQGTAWTAGNRAAYYSQDQGSRLMPLAWMQALKQPDGQPFLADNLTRYGYLANIAVPAATLPVGFTTNGPPGQAWLGLTCSACHTRQIEVNNVTYRIDGGPAIADFEAMVADLDKAVGAILADSASFSVFAKTVLGAAGTDPQVQALRQQVSDWFKPFHTIVSRALPPKPWGPARLDAVGMIFNRLSGLDIGTASDHIIASNIHIADSPVRYPFLWNASRQDQTQWPGFAQNGDALLGLARNTGEVIGVFAEFHPFREAERLVLGVNYSVNEEDKLVNSSNTDGLLKLEDLIAQIGPPRWPGPASDKTLAEAGEAIFNLPAAQGGCAECHAARPGAHRLFQPEETWSTPVQDVGTDNREWKMIGVPGQAAFPGWTVDTGALSGAEIPFLPKLKPTDSAFNTLRIAVVGTILQRLPQIGRFSVAAETSQSFLTGAEKTTGVNPGGAAAQDLFGAYNRTATPTTAATPFKFESRVLAGIWATAPYLHNGSVPTLYDLLNTQAQRPKSFRIGPAYDLAKVGLAEQQTKFDYILTTTGCEDRSSGTSNCGHEFGTTTLKLEQKRALLEYLKTL